jgi:hypothetical protein
MANWGSILNTNTNTNALKYLWRYITMQRQRVRFPLPKVCQYIYTLTTKIKSFNMPFFLWRPLINWTWFEIDRNIVLRYEYCIYCKCWFFYFWKIISLFFENRVSFLYSKIMTARFESITDLTCKHHKKQSVSWTFFR